MIKNERIKIYPASSWTWDDGVTGEGFATMKMNGGMGLGIRR